MFKLGKWSKRVVCVGLAAGAVLFANSYQGVHVAGSPLPVATAPSLDAAQSFAVLGGSTVTNTGPTTINGDLGLYPGTSITGLPSITLIGTVHQTDAVAQQAQDAVTAAYNNLAGQTCDTPYGVPTDLGGLNLIPGVYCFSSSAQLTGILTLNAQGNDNAVWVFKIGSSLTTASGSSVVFINGGSPCNVFWQVTSAATLGTGSTFVGSILALTSITLNTGASLSGRALARNGAVTMDSNTISSAVCLAAPAPTATTGPATPTATTGPATPAATTGPATPAATTGPATPTATTGPATPTAAAGSSTDRCIGNIRGSKTDVDGQRLAGWTVRLLQANEVVRTAVTDGNGNFDFLGLEMGAYTVREEQRTGWSAQGPTSIEATLTACDQNLTGYTFVNVPAAATPAPPTASPVSPGPTETTGPATEEMSGPGPTTATPEAAPTPTVAVMPTTLPRAGDPPVLRGMVMVWLALGGAGAVLLGLSMRRRSR